MHYTGNDQSRLAATVEWTWPHSSHTLGLLRNHQTDLKDRDRGRKRSDDSQGLTSDGQNCGVMYTEIVVLFN